jgi:hypothetical protein
VLRDRFHRAQNSELGRQQRTIRRRWEEAREETAGTLRANLVAPGTVELYPIVAELKTFGHGIAYMAREWLRLKKAINTRGFLTPEEANMGVRLMGVLPGLETVARHKGAFLFTVWSARCHPLSPAGMLEVLLQPANRPAGLEPMGAAELLPEPGAARDQIIKWVDEELAALEALADRIAREVDGPELARVLNPAAIVIDPEKIKRYDRARCTYQMMYFRAKKTLDDHREGDAPAQATSRAARGPDINPLTPDGGIAAGPSSMPGGVTEVLRQPPDAAPDQGADGVSQNGREIGPDRAAGDHPGASRSNHKQVAKRPAGTVLRGHGCGKPPQTRRGRISTTTAERMSRQRKDVLATDGTRIEHG